MKELLDRIREAGKFSPWVHSVADGEVTLDGNFDLVKLREALFDSRISYWCAHHAPEPEGREQHVAFIRCSHPDCGQPPSRYLYEVLPTSDPLEKLLMSFIRIMESSSCLQATIQGDEEVMQLYSSIKERIGLL